MFIPALVQISRGHTVWLTSKNKDAGQTASMHGQAVHLLVASSFYHVMTKVIYRTTPNSFTIFFFELNEMNLSRNHSNANPSNKKRENKDNMQKITYLVLEKR